MTATEIEKALERFGKRLDAHSRYIANEVMSFLEKVQDDLDRVWV